jgi:hypothetical protein
MRGYSRWVIVLALCAWASEGRAALVGNDVSVGRAQASDGAENVLQVDFGDPIPAAGTVDSYSIFDQPGNNQPNYSFHAYVLRPTGGSNYLVLQDDVLIPTGTNATKSYAVSPITVQAGDVIAHYGRGVPYADGPAGGDFEEIFFPSGPPPAANTTIQLPSATYPRPSGFVRDYAFAANFVVPEPAGLAVVGLGAVALFARRRRS